MANEEDPDTALAIMDDYERRLELQLELSKWYFRKVMQLIYAMATAIAVHLAFGYVRSWLA